MLSSSRSKGVRPRHGAGGLGKNEGGRVLKWKKMVGFPCKNDQRNLKPRQTSNDGEIVCLIMVYKSWIKLTYYGIYERVGCSLPITWKKYASNWIFCSKFWGKHVHKNCLLKPTKRPPSGKLTWQWNPPFEDVFPTRKWGFSNAMLVFRDVKWMSLRKIVMILFPLLQGFWQAAMDTPKLPYFERNTSSRITFCGICILSLKKSRM